MTTYETPRSNSWDSSGAPLISSQRVTGSDVYDASGEKLGSIDDLVIDKQSGQVRFAVMSFGGFLGIGAKYHQLPWNGLRYDEHSDGYVVNLSRTALEGAPTYDQQEIQNFDYANGSNGIDEYYGRIDGFYSPEQQSLRNGGVGANSLNTSKVSDYRDDVTGGELAIDDDRYQPGSSFSTSRN